ncbi:trimeric LpxA-like protein [Pleomassaria siparia CBS 279.74]|uniref:Dynactin subunit 6 n=1 Tax=Pleomassaria siparia CBS 279.74 TaxID=1314801 RepID=A0A6G1K9U4_9PLEO|nr:trimeric LpxA-like protein [Pleomassaria siparia CBS 279.74]
MSAQLTPHTSASAPDRRTSTIQKRTSMLPRPASIVLDDSVLIAQHAQLTGSYPITAGPNTVLHPHSKISSVMAPVVLGEGVVIYERARIGVASGGDAGGMMMAESASGGRADGTVLGRNVVVETNAVVEAAEVGEGSTVEVGALVGRGCVIGKYCTITAAVVLAPNTHIPDYTVVFAGSQQRIDRTLKDRPEAQLLKTMMHRKQLDIFKKLVPNNAAKWRMG